MHTFQFYPKHFCILVTVPVLCGTFLVPIFFISAENTLFSAIWEEISEHELQHQSREKNIFNTQLAFFFVQVGCRLNALFTREVNA